MPELICHLLGDYVFQNHWMANNKVKAWWPALVHALIYSLMFVMLKPSLVAWLVIFGTHLLIDRFRLAKYWVEWYGVGEPGQLWQEKYRKTIMPPEDWAVWEDYMDNSAEYAVAVWLLIIVDNTFHLTINHLALKYL